MIDPIKIAMISGGRTSGYMLCRLLDTHPNYRNDFITIFCNTGKEMPQTLDFVHEMETRWEVPFVWLEYHRKLASEIPPGIYPTKRRNSNLLRSAQRGETVHWFKQVTYTTASRNGEPFDELLNYYKVLPNVINRMCSSYLKVRVAHRYVFSLGHAKLSSFIGIRADESHRKIQILSGIDHFDQPQFPLCDENVTRQNVNDFWKSQPFDLQLQDYQGNCDLCFLKRKANRVRMIRENPGISTWWKAWEMRRSDKGSGGVFRRGEPISLLEELAKQDAKSLACDPNDVDIPCSCVEKAFDKNDETEDAL